MQYANQHMQQYPLPGAPQEAELVGSGLVESSASYSEFVPVWHSNAISDLLCF